MEQDGSSMRAEISRRIRKQEKLEAELKQEQETAEAGRQEIARLERLLAKTIADAAAAAAAADNAAHLLEEDSKDADDTMVRNLMETIYEKDLVIAARDRTIAQERENVARLKREMKALGMHGERTKTDMERRLALEQEEKEKQAAKLRAELRDQHAQARRMSANAEAQLRDLQRMKEEEEARLIEEREALAAEKRREEERLQVKIDKFRQLQEMALTVTQDTQQSGKALDRVRQLMYYESLKSKTQDKSSISWRGSDEFAHEKVAGTKTSLSRNAQEAISRAAKASAAKGIIPKSPRRRRAESEQASVERAASGESSPRGRRSGASSSGSKHGAGGR